MFKIKNKYAFYNSKLFFFLIIFILLGSLYFISFYKGQKLEPQVINFSDEIIYFSSNKDDLKILELFDCLNKPNDLNKIFYGGKINFDGIPWQNNNPEAPCYYECINGYSGFNCDIKLVYKLISGELGKGGSGIILDENTGLEWMNDGSNSSLSWSGAMDFCENLEYGGLDDWRLPTKDELESLVDKSKNPTIDTDFFSSYKDYYWTTTSYKTSKWVINFGNGNSAVMSLSENYLYNVRCVRGE